MDCRTRKAGEPRDRAKALDMRVYVAWPEIHLARARCPALAEAAGGDGARTRSFNLGNDLKPMWVLSALLAGVRGVDDTTLGSRTLSGVVTPLELTGLRPESTV
jgi:hypothetical protein